MFKARSAGSHYIISRCAFSTLAHVTRSTTISPMRRRLSSTPTHRVVTIPITVKRRRVRHATCGKGAISDAFTATKSTLHICVSSFAKGIFGLCATLLVDEARRVLLARMPHADVVGAASCTGVCVELRALNCGATAAEALLGSGPQAGHHRLALAVHALSAVL
eukprot:CAMPEP_0180437314 /NCGR_PEP_ID=MMETSP1036_2-20121128/11480_1 /TAXON_ID=632150 /ORGANISM="Azadinium spinosum, Strain 3D9" /LENGTH=163 /DNA_ID=CAMNT_0022443361 /DNA_START=287 /DNA_END=778 /DNA_ORIENTATION=+